MRRLSRGMAYAYGQGVPRDQVRALMWFILAGSATHYRLVAGHMTELQISHATALAEMRADSRFTNCE